MRGASGNPRARLNEEGFWAILKAVLKTQSLHILPQQYLLVII